MLENVFYHQLQQKGIMKKVYFQRDGAPFHFSLVARVSVSQSLGDKWIRRGGMIEWAPNSLYLRFFMGLC